VDFGVILTRGRLATNTKSYSTDLIGFSLAAVVTDAPRDEPAGPDGGERIAQEMRLRSDRPRVTRLSRKVLVGLGAVAAAGIGAALFFALQPRHETAGSELYNTGNRSTPDGLANLPRDYTGLPRNAPQLGPPLPGDLGRPILNAGASPNPEQQRMAQEHEAARTSHLFATTNTRQVAAVAAPGAAPVYDGPVAPAVAGSSDLTAQDHKLAFLNGAVDRRSVSPDRVQAPASHYVLQAGAVIPAALITGLRSDLPGQVTAQVTEDSYDSPTGKILLIPQGARLVGQYDAQVTFGQARALLVWNRLIMPNGRSIVLERQPGADPEGYAGLEDEVDNHWDMLFKAAVLSTILSVGSEAGTSNNEDALVQALRQGASDSISQTGRQVVQRSLNVQPTITIRPGFPVRVLVTHDLVLEPYRG
jgi:type IV secretory pathway VirB10-like protein